MITTLIFDLDGLLADTEKLHRQAYQEVLGEMRATISDQEYETHWIRDGRGIADFIAAHGLSIDPDAVRINKSIRYKELVLAKAEAMPGALRTLDLFYPLKTLALATASYQDAAYAVLETLCMKNYFACIATHANAPRMKPFPDLFLWVASKLGVQPSECLVFEDAQKGILAAAAAGMRSIAIPNTHTRHNDFSRATMILPCLDAVTPATLADLERLPVA